MKHKTTIIAVVTAILIGVVGLSIFLNLFKTNEDTNNLVGSLVNSESINTSNEQSVEPLGYTKEDVIRESKDYFNYKPFTKDKSVKANPKMAEFKQALDAVFAVPWQNRAVASLDKLFREILTSHELTRQEKITLLWEYAQTRDSDIEYRYVVESIGTLSPIELIDPIITSYQFGISKERKRVLLSLINEALYVGEVNKYPQAQQDFIGANFIQAQRFLKSSLYSETDTDLVMELMSAYTNATGDEQEIANVARDFLSAQTNTKIPEQKRERMLLEIALENKNLQETILPQLLTPENRNDIDFYDTVSVLVAEFGKSGNHNFSEQGKAAFHNFISSELIDYTQDKEIDSNKENFFFNRLEALSALQADGVTQQPHQVLANYVLDNYVSKQSNPLEIATVLSLAEKPAVDILKQRSSEILPLLEQSLKNPELALSESKKQLIQLGIDALTESRTEETSEENS